jgi:hypothetical protein
LFPEYEFIKKEFYLKGDVHGLGKEGRIDILAYNSDEKRFAVFELKRDFNANVFTQAMNYSSSVHVNFQEVFIRAKDEHKATLAPMKDMKQEVEIVLIAGTFSDTQIKQARALKKMNVPITLIEYCWFVNDCFLLNYVHNAPYIDEDDTPYNEGEGGSITAKTPEQIWDKIRLHAERLENTAKTTPDGHPLKEKRAVFVSIVNECIAKKDAQRLCDEAKIRNQGHLINYSKMILDQE